MSSSALNHRDSADNLDVGSVVEPLLEDSPSNIKGIDGGRASNAWPPIQINQSVSTLFVLLSVAVVQSVVGGLSKVCCSRWTLPILAIVALLSYSASFLASQNTQQCVIKQSEAVDNAISALTTPTKSAIESGPSVPVFNQYPSIRSSPPGVRSSRIVLLIVADEHHGHKYVMQAATIECYAMKQKYEFVRLNPRAPEFHFECNRYQDFFFSKHCAVRVWLSQQPFGLTAAIFDGDTVGMVSNKSLSHWLGGEDADSDVIMYERDWNFEIMAGNYIVRNSPYTHAFLRTWSDFEYQRPPGYSSADNGAIHLVVLHMLGFHDEEIKRCVNVYKSLTVGVDNLVPYYGFVCCTKKVLGPARRWLVPLGMGGEQKAQFTILNRLHAWVLDGFISDWRTGYFHAFHHGVKDPENVVKQYGFHTGIGEFPLDVKKITGNEKIHHLPLDAKECGIYKPLPPYASLQAQGEHLSKTEGSWLSNGGEDTGQCYRWPIADCTSNFSCRSLDNDEQIKTVPLIGSPNTKNLRRDEQFVYTPRRAYKVL